MIHLTR